MDEMMKLWRYLTEHDYCVRWEYRIAPLTIFSHTEDLYRNQIIVYDREDGTRLWDAICHPGSYGYEQGLLEIYGVICNDVIGCLTADDIIKF